jgi:hypothetical protein
MSQDSAATWFETNQRYLTLSLARIRGLIQRQAGGEPASLDFAGETELQSLAASMSAPPALNVLCSLFGLSAFERDILLLCAGMELDSQFASLIAPLNAPTFSLALSILPEAHWSALTTIAPLRRWRLLEVGSGTGLSQSPLRIDEPILHYLTGTGYMDERLSGYVEMLPPAGKMVPSHQAAAEQIANAWSKGADGRALPIIQLFGMDGAARQQVAGLASAMLGLGLNSMRVAVIPSNPVEMEALMRLWERQAILGSQALLLNCENGELTHAMRWIEAARFPLILSTRERIPVNGREVFIYEIRKPTPAEQVHLWRQALGPAATRLNGYIDQLTGHFDLDVNSIETISTNILSANPGPDSDLGDSLWQACRDQSHPRLGELAQNIQSMAVWDDLVLPATQLQTLREVAIHVRQRMKIYEDWGFAAKSARGLGISALFSGASGTGKTMAAEVLANELRLDLYRIDLSQVVSKYIGETEKNLRRVFDAAEQGGAILLFDEADALFGKRSEVKDSHDRYANVEVSYLLQRMESYRGLAILTTNLKDAIDTAFLRRIRFVVQFPFPDSDQRAEIWRHIFPRQTPTEGLEVDRLARLSVAGGNIRNIALHAAFLAADSGEPVRMNHLLRAARAEYAKLEKPLSEAEIGGWV